MISDVYYTFDTYPMNVASNSTYLINIINNFLNATSSLNEFSTMVHSTVVADSVPDSGSYVCGGMIVYLANDKAVYARQGVDFEVPMLLCDNNQLDFSIKDAFLLPTSDLTLSTNRRNIYNTNLKQFGYSHTKIERTGSFCGTSPFASQDTESFNMLELVNNGANLTFNGKKTLSNIYAVKGNNPQVVDPSNFKTPTVNNYTKVFGLMASKGINNYDYEPVYLNAPPNDLDKRATSSISLSVSTFGNFRPNTLTPKLIYGSLVGTSRETSYYRHLYGVTINGSDMTFPIIPVIGVQLKSENICLIDFILQAYSATITTHSSVYITTPQLATTTNFYNNPYFTVSSDMSEWSFNYVANSLPKCSGAGAYKKAKQGDWFCIVNGNLFIIENSFFNKNVFTLESELKDFHSFMSK